MKKPYEKPAVVYTEKLEVRAIACLKNADGVDLCSQGLAS